MSNKDNALRDVIADIMEDAAARGITDPADLMLVWEMGAAAYRVARAEMADRVECGELAMASVPSVARAH